MRWYILLALVSLTVLILTEEAEGWWGGRRRRTSSPSSSTRRRYTAPSSSGRRRSSYSRRRRSASQGCGYLYCYNGGTKYCASGWWSSKKTAKCRCRSWTSGRQCYTITCPGKSCNGGKKYCSSRGVSACRCRSGYSGSSCQYGCSYKYCYNGGKKYCVKGFWGGKKPKCNCPHGWGGHDCRTAVCPKKHCKNRGTRYCVRGSAYCRCQPGFSGSNCENGCPPKKCLNKGTKYCVNGFWWGGRVAKCKCPNGFAGHDCGKGCPKKTCYNGGTRFCANGFLWGGHVAKCKCALGWHGDDCRKICPSFKCKHGKVGCTKHFWIFTFSHCVCDKGWKGKHCHKSKAVDKNKGNKNAHTKGGKANKNSGCNTICYNGGRIVCNYMRVQGIYYGTCSCKGGFYGSQCQHRSHCIFYLSTNGGLSNKVISDRSSLTGYRGSKKTVVLIHGWRGAYDKSWIKTSKKELLKKNDVGNVIVLDWGKWHRLSLSNYDQAAKDSRVVGEKLAKLIKYIISKTKSKPASFYLVGNSLGAHVAGFAGQSFIKENNKKLGRITGLDPAGNLFNGKPKHSRLDASDADFVDVIHTRKTGFLGTKDESGYFDFWPNGGENQKGCISGICHHGRAAQLYVESINSQCVFRSYRCTSWDQFNRGNCRNCKNGCPEMGYNAYKYKSLANGNFFLDTNEKKPFCVTKKASKKTGDTNISS